MDFQLPASLPTLAEHASRYDYGKPEAFAVLSKRLEGATALSSEDLATLIAWKSPETKENSQYLSCPILRRNIKTRQACRTCTRQSCAFI